MATGNISFVVQFQTSNGYAFSERHYLYGITSVTDPNAAVRAAVFVSFRINLLGAGATLLAIELHDSLNLRSTLQIPLSPAFPPPAAGKAYNAAFNAAYTVAEGVTADFAFSDLMCRKEAAITGGIVYHANYFLACNPDVIQQVGVFPANDPVWLPAFTSFRNNCFGTPAAPQSIYGMLVLDRTTAGSPLFLVTNVTLNSSNQPVLTLASAGPFVAGQQITVRGIKGNIPSQINGIRYAGQGTAGTSVVLSNVTMPAGWTYKGGGGVIARNRVVVPYSNLLQSRFTHRKRGSSLFGLRGSKYHKRSTST